MPQVDQGNNRSFGEYRATDVLVTRWESLDRGWKATAIGIVVLVLIIVL